MSKYKVYGDYGYNSQTLLAEHDTLTDALNWADAYCADGDFGGYSMIEVAWFAEDGEYVTERRFDPEDYQDETEWSAYDTDYCDTGSHHHW